MGLRVKGGCWSDDRSAVPSRPRNPRATRAIPAQSYSTPCPFPRLMSSPEARLKELGITLPEAPKPVAAYIPFVRTGNLVVISGQLPFVDGKLEQTGRLGKDVSVEDGQRFARLAAINALAVVKAAAGSLDNVARVVRVGVFVASEDSFTAQPQVANGASELLVEVFGDAGRHARAAVGVNVLPLGTPVEVEMMVELRE